MLSYEKLYRIVFNGITDALDSMEKEGYAQAKMKLIDAQRAAEDYFINGEDNDLNGAAEFAPIRPLYALPEKEPDKGG
jgi:hypothetical protein